MAKPSQSLHSRASTRSTTSRWPSQNHLQRRRKRQQLPPKSSPSRSQLMVQRLHLPRAKKAARRASKPLLKVARMHLLAKARRRRPPRSQRLLLQLPPPLTICQRSSRLSRSAISASARFSSVRSILKVRSFTSRRLTLVSLMVRSEQFSQACNHM